MLDYNQLSKIINVGHWFFIFFYTWILAVLLILHRIRTTKEDWREKDKRDERMNSSVFLREYCLSSSDAAYVLIN
jgi:hypothetical protein